MQTDDEIKFNVLYKTYKSYVRNVCRKYTSDSDQLDDFVSDAFVRIHKNIKNVNLDCCKTYISKITSSSCIDNIRKNDKHKNDVSIDTDNFYDTTVYDAGLDSQNTEEYIKSVIYKLEYPYRDIFVMFAIDGLRHKEIAEKLNMNINTVRCNYMKAKNAVSETIKQEMFLSFTS